MKIKKQERVYLTREENEILMQAKRICGEIYKEVSDDKNLEFIADEACDGLGYLLDVAEFEEVEE